MNTSNQSPAILPYIDRVYATISELNTLSVTAYGPQRADEGPPEVRTIQATGRELKRASSNPKQGRWLTELAKNATEQTSDRACVVEIGTCVGISGMYLLAGMANRNGGHLVTFEGSPELAEIAENNLKGVIKKLGSKNLTFEIVQGPLANTFKNRISELDCTIDLAFVDGNHQENATVEYHQTIRPKMSPKGVIVHDDIAWGEGMARAWKNIKQLESNHSIEELQLGWKPSRGVIRLGEPSSGDVRVHHIDGIFERLARAMKNKLR